MSMNQQPIGDSGARRPTLKERIRAQREAAANTDPRVIAATASTDDEAVHIRTTTEEIEISTDDVIIEEYQRNFSPYWARWIAKNFDVDLFDKPLVAPAGNGKYAVIDGQHRVAALRLRFPGHPVTFIADVDHGATSLPKQAKRFSGRNHYVRKTTTRDHLRALIVEGDRDARAFEEIVSRAGFKIKWGGGKMRPGLVPPVVFKNIQKRCPGTWERDLAETLETCAKAWGHTDFPLETDFIVGMAMFIRMYRNDAVFDLNRLADKLSDHMPAALVTKGATLRALKEVGSVDYGVRKILVGVYNTNAHSRKLEA